MKKKTILSKVIFTVLALIYCFNASAQSIEKRVKTMMTITYQGQQMDIELSAVNLMLSNGRNYFGFSDVVGNPQQKNEKTDGKRNLNLALVVISIDDNVYKLVSAKEIKFDGSIRITDTYGKIKDKVIMFKQGNITSLNDQLSSENFGFGYSGNSSMTLSVEKFIINGIEIEL